MTDMTGAASWSISRRLRGEEYRRPRIWRATTPVKEAAEMGARLDPRYGLNDSSDARDGVRIDRSRLDDRRTA